ncbi:U3 small nucleolar ribonucleoprotein complex, subunit Mpp10 [Globomyces pollinis-pini]|nr:U3 small nucleolar ribonucleoprotein complex, subunit Mpp10 [Globomyces pollinis-pini]
MGCLMMKIMPMVCELILFYRIFFSFQNREQLLILIEIHYDDFFVAPKVAKSARKTWRDDMEPLDGTEELQEDLNEVEGDDPLEEQNEDLNEDADQPMDLLDDEEEEDIDMDKNNLSTFEKQQLKMKAKIDQFETENMAEKDWTLKGEANSKQRPMNSLLEEDLDVDIAVKPVPVITEETTATLADLIIQRIKDMAFDDVVRKAPPKDSVYDPNRRWELDDEKNKKSLAEVYEDEYKKQTSKDEVKTDRQLEVEKQHAEISELYNNLTYQLDALSNWHFTPKPASLEVEVVPTASVPAISLEEVIPANVSNAKLALPREVYDGKVAKSQAELDEKDKKRLRMKAKRIARKEKLEKEKAKQLYQKDDKLSHQVTKDKAMSQLMKQRNVTLVVDSNSSKKKFGKGQAKVIGKTDKIVQEKVKSKPEMLRL